MSARVVQVLLAVLLLPLLAGCMLLLVPLLVGKAPVIICEQRRAIRWLLPLASLYHGAWLVIALAAALFLSLDWMLVGFPFFGMMFCLLPSPWSFLFSVRQRRAVFAAIAHQERLVEEFGPLYNDVSVFATEADRLIIRMFLNSSTKPLFRKFVAVYDDGLRVEDLKYEDVAERYEVPLLM